MHDLTGNQCNDFKLVSYFPSEVFLIWFYLHPYVTGKFGASGKFYQFSQDMEDILHNLRDSTIAGKSCFLCFVSSTHIMQGIFKKGMKDFSVVIFNVSIKFVTNLLLNRHMKSKIAQSVVNKLLI